MGLWTQHCFRVISEQPQNVFGKEYSDHEFPCGKTLEEKEAWLEENNKIWDYIYSHPEEYLPVGECETLKYLKQNETFSYTFLGEKRTAYETVFYGATPDSSDLTDWFRNKCKQIPNVLYIYAYSCSDLIGLSEYRHQSIGMDKEIRE